MASKVIKGLTVEIGGDTTKLGKALESVNKKSVDLSAELKEVNKLLKFDPGNADLLAQKQKILAESISNTKEKLETLETAEKQVQAQFARGEVSEAQVRALQREIVETTNRLKYEERQAAEVADAIDKMGKAGGKDTLSKKVADQTKKLTKLKKEYTDVVAAEGKKSRSAQKLEKEITELSAELKDNQRQLEKAGQAAEEAAGDYNEFAGSADKAEKSSGGFGSAVAGGVAKGVAVAGAAVTAAVGVMAGAAEASREYRTEMGKLDAAFTSSGHSSKTATATYKELYSVIGETDQAVEASQQIALLATSEQDAAKWAELGAGVVGKFGDALQPETFFEAANETMKLGESTGAYTQMLEGCGISVDEFNAGLAACSTEAEKQAYMLEVTNGALGSAGKAYRENNAEIIRANQANEEWNASLAEVGAAVEPILSDVKLLGASLVSDFVPGVKSAADALRGMLNGEEGATEKFGSALSGMITQLLDKIVELAPTIVDAGMSLLTSLTTTLISMLPQLVETGVGLVMSIIEGLTQALPQIATALAEMIPQLVTVIEQALPQIIEGVLALVNALTSSIDQILPPLIEAVPRIIMAIVTALLDNLPVLLDGVITAVLMLVSYADDIIASLLPLIPQIITALLDALAKTTPTILSAILALIGLLVTEVLPNIIKEIVLMIPKLLKAIDQGHVKILASIIKWFGQLFSKIGEWLGKIINKVTPWVKNMVSKAKEMGSKFVNAVVNFFKQLPGKVWSFLSNVISKVGSWASNIAGKARDAGGKFVSAVVNFFTQLPGKIWTWLSNAANKVASWGSSLVAKGKAAVQKLVNTVVNTVKSLPGKMTSAGKNLVQGLWKGINGAYSWLKSKIKGWVGNVTDFLKKLFGINSPSKVTAYDGRMLAEGYAVGLEENADAPINAMRDLSEDMLNATGDIDGMALERSINHTFAAPKVSNPMSNLGAKLDALLEAVKQGQFIYLDGDKLVGSTATRYDNTLGQRRVLVDRGAL